MFLTLAPFFLFRLLLQRLRIHYSICHVPENHFLIIVDLGVLYCSLYLYSSLVKLVVKSHFDVWIRPRMYFISSKVTASASGCLISLIVIYF